MDLADLPEYCVVEVAQYLSFTDVVACSKVSRRWRSAFDKNSIWRRYHTINRHYFSKQVSQLGQEEVWEGCEAKQHVFKELTVLRNIYKSNFHQTVFDSGYVDCHSVADTVDEAGNHWLFVLADKQTGFDEFELQMWNLNSNPVLHMSMKMDSSLSHNVQKMRAHDMNIFFTLYNEVHVYKIFSPENVLRFAFKVVISEQFYPWFICINNKILGFFHSNVTVSQSLPPHVKVWGEEGALLFDGGPYVVTHQETNVQMTTLKLAHSNKNSNYISLATSHALRKLKNVSVHLFNIIQFQFINICSLENVYDYCHGISSSLVCLSYKFDSLDMTKLKVFNFEGIEVNNVDLEKSVDVWKLLSGSSDQEILLVGYNRVIVVNLWDGKQDSCIKGGVGYGYVKQAVTVKENFLLIQRAFGHSTISRLWNYKTGHCFDYLTRAWFGYWCHSYSFYKNCLFPPKIVAVENQPDFEHSRLTVLSFW